MIDLDDLGPTISAAEYAELLGVSTWAIYQHQDELPVAPLHVGRRLRWPTRKVLDSLGEERAA